ncbi:serine/threonine-protein kinase [Streptomyces sp. NPDC050610]|uniref:serine/threonine-protein kinase n=1 Tax=Streptomyces sp. NPDC050610 TaxID=3157097 RepID=UPI003431E865
MSESVTGGEPGTQSDEQRLVAGRYRLLERIGRGGMGTVWRAEDELLGRQVALKQIHISPYLEDDELATLYERTRREARSAARIAHPNVVVVHDVVEDRGRPCIVMEYVPSTTLGDVLKQFGTISPEETARIGRGMIAALRAAHGAGVLHRDVKPGNVLLGAEGRVVLTDFGIAQSSGTSTLTKTGEMVGSIDYIAPERVKGGSPGPASDLWALGATLYQALEGRPPFRKDTPVETAYSIAVDPFEPPRNAGPLAKLVETLLAKEPEFRPPAELVEQILREPMAEAETAYIEAMVKPTGSTTGGGSTAGAVGAAGVTGVTNPGFGPAMDMGTGTATGTGAGTGQGYGPASGTGGGTGYGSASATGAGPATGTGMGTGTDPATGFGTGPTTPTPTPTSASAPTPAQAPTAPTRPTHPTHPTQGSDPRAPGPGTGATSLAEASTAPSPGQGSQSSQGKSRRRGRTVLWTAVAVVAGIAAAGGGYYFTHEYGAAGDSSASTGASGKQDPKPTASSPAKPSPGKSELPAPPPVPDGYRKVTEKELGVSFPVPEGWTRQEKNSTEVNYIDPSGLARIQVNVLDFASSDPLQHWKEVEEQVQAEQRGYKLGRMQNTKYLGEEAAVWEFTFQGKAREFRAIDLGFGHEGGNEYAIYLSAPSSMWDQYRPVFDSVRDGFRPRK